MVSSGETWLLTLYKRKKNSQYEYEDTPLLTFYGRPTKAYEQTLYTVQTGVTNGADDTYVFSSNLPVEVSVGDRVLFLGKMWSVGSTGVYLEEGRYVNASVLDPDFILKNCPKGITLK